MNHTSTTNIHTKKFNKINPSSVKIKAWTCFFGEAEKTLLQTIDTGAELNISTSKPGDSVSNTPPQI